MLIQRSIIKLMGFSSQGDLGPLTTYTSSRGQLVVFPRSSPLNPPSFQQQQMREFFSLCAQAWQSMTEDSRNVWNSIADGARCRVTGYNLWIYYQRRQDAATIRTLARQAGVASPV